MLLSAHHLIGPVLINMSSTSKTKIVLYVEDDADHRELFRRAAKTCQAKFALAMAHGLYDAIDYLGGALQYRTQHLPCKRGVVNYQNVDHWAYRNTRRHLAIG